MTSLYLLINGEQKGPYSEDQVRSMYLAGTITSDVHYWLEGQSDWLPVDGLFPSARFVSPPPPSRIVQSTRLTESQPQKKAVAKKRSGLTVLLFVVSFFSACYGFSNLQPSDYENKLKDAADYGHSASSDLQAAGDAAGVTTSASQMREESDVDYLKIQNLQDARIGRATVGFVLSGFCFLCALVSMLISKSGNGN